MSEDGLYEVYQREMSQLEERREEYEWKRRRFDEYREQAQAEMLDDRRQVEVLLNRWGDCQDSGILLSEFEASVEKEYQELQKREAELQEEHRQIRREQASCEDRYYEEQRKIQEELCQE